MVTVEDIKDLRDRTGLSIAECKKALEESDGDKDKALDVLKSRGADIAAKKASRNLGAGTVVSYIHASGTVGVMLEFLCETDFVAKNPEFKSLAYDIAMHIAAMAPENTEELLEQAYIKDTSKTVGDLVNGAVQKFGERSEVGQFVRFSIS